MLSEVRKIASVAVFKDRVEWAEPDGEGLHNAFCGGSARLSAQVRWVHRASIGIENVPAWVPLGFGPDE